MNTKLLEKTQKTWDVLHDVILLRHQDTLMTQLKTCHHVMVGGSDWIFVMTSFRGHYGNYHGSS